MYGSFACCYRWVMAKADKAAQLRHLSVKDPTKEKGLFSETQKWFEVRLQL